MSELRDHVVLMTGASGALGTALATRVLAAGARLATLERRRDPPGEERVGAPPGPPLADRNPATAGAKRTLASALASAGVDLADRLLVHTVDFHHLASIEQAVAATIARWGRLDHVFNTVGAWGSAPSVEATPDALWDSLWDANVRAVLQTCRAAVPVMKTRGGGTVVNVAARAALHADAGGAAYAVAKTAVVRLTEALSAEGRQAGIRANCVLPGTIDTPANRDAMPTADTSEWVTLDALVDVLLFLASPASRAIHGAAIPVYGPG